MLSTSFLSRKIAFAILSVVFFKTADSLSNTIELRGRNAFLKLWFGTRIFIKRVTGLFLCMLEFVNIAITK